MRKKNYLTFFLLLFASMIYAQQKNYSGKVTDGKDPLPSVSIINKTSNNATVTDIDGKFTISAKEGDKLEVSYIGFTTATVSVGKSTEIVITLKESIEQMDEVVVIGYGVQRKKDVTGSISKISGSDIQGLVTPSFESQLAGRASGVQITAPTGIIGEAPRIRIRGTASISSGTYPLIIVDGMPIYTGDLGGYASSNAMGDINPNDIESFEILKDGAATAIYGSRAANGVILITTKKGKKGVMKSSYNNVIGFAKPIETFNLLNTEQFLEIANEKRTNRGQAAWAVGNEFDTDWQKAVLRNNVLQMDHNFSANGGTDKTKYFMSLGYTEQDGIAKANSMVRYNVRANLEQEIKSWLTAGVSLANTRTEYNGLNTGRNSLSGNIFNAIRQLPNTPIYDANNPTGYNITQPLNINTVGQWTNTDPVGDNISNIVYVLDKNKYYSKVNRTLANAFLTAKINSNFNYRMQASVDNAQTSGFLFWDPTHGDGRSTNGRLQNDHTDLLRWNFQNILSYNQTFREDHNVSATFVTEHQKEKNQSFFGIGTDLLSDFYNQNLVTNSYAVQQSGGGVSEVGIISYVGRLSYNYKQKYFAQGSIRRDGLSKLSPDTRWDNFTGFSGGWNIAKENFMSSFSDVVSELKFRGSYSEVGNTEIGSYPYLGLTTSSPYGSLNGIAFSQFGNNDLRWETSKKYDFGFDLAMFNERFRLSFDYFKNDIDGLIMRVPVAPSLGVPNNIITQNIGSMYNEGLEFSAEYKVLAKSDFRWDVSANLTLQDNKVTSIPNAQDILGGTSSDVNIAPNLIIRQGESINSLYGYRYWGVNPANGNPVYYKKDGSLVQGNLPTSTYFVFDPNNPTDMSTSSNLVASEDKVVLGNTLPKYFGAFTSKMSYKNFDLGFLVRFSGGNKIFNSTRRDLLTMNLNNNGTEILGRWQSVDQPGDGMTPRLWASNNTFVNLTGHATTRFVENGDFISLDNITLGYTVPSTIAKKINVDAVRVFVQGQNMLMITDYRGINPEMETSGVDLNGTPRSKVFAMGINVNF
jgi:TonB-dependent starch-binding outer membrane protein SusC